MKNKLMALTLALLMIVSAIPAGAIGMVGVETADEISVAINETEYTAKTSAVLDEGIILSEGFEDIEAGTVVSAYADKDTCTAYKALDLASVAEPVANASLRPGDQLANVSVVEFGGSNVLKVDAVSGYSNTYRMVTLELFSDAGKTKGLTNDHPGKYSLSYRYYITGGATEAHIATAFDGTWWGRDWTDINHNTWVDYKVDFEISPDGKLTSSDWNGNPSTKDFSGNVSRFDFITQYTASASDICYYIDDIKLAYEPITIVTLTYVDKSGNTLYTQSATSNSSVTLAGETELGFVPMYEIDGKVYMKSTYTPATDKTIVVSETNIVFLEDFESYSVGDKLYREGDLGSKVLPPIWFGIKPSYMVEDYEAEIANTDCYEITLNGNTYRSTDSIDIAETAGNKYLIFKGYKAKFNNSGFNIKGLDFSKEGTYKLSMNLNVRKGTGGTWHQVGGGLVDPGSIGSGKLIGSSENEFVYFESTFKVAEKDGSYTIDATHNLTANTSTTVSASAVTAGQFKIYFNCANEGVDGDGSQPVEVYVDDIMLTYEEPVVISATFADDNGNAFDYSDVQEGKFVLPTAADLGLSYEPKFTDPNGNEYYPGTVYNIGGDVEFIVSESDVVLFEDFEETTTGNNTPAYVRGTLAGATIDCTSATISPDGDGAYKTQNISRDPTKYSDTPSFLQNFDISKPGVYTFSVDVELEVVKSADTDVVDNGFYANIQIIPGWNGICSNTVLNSDNPKATLTGVITVYEKNGELYYKAGGNAEKPYTTITDAANKWIRIGYVHSKDFKEATGTKAAHYAYADNFKVTYTPYSPETIKLASYRPENENETGGPAGIRFVSYVTDGQKTQSSEFGFVVTRKALITSDGVIDYDKLNLNGVEAVAYDKTTSAVNSDNVKVVARAAYNGTSSRIYTDDGNNINSSYKGLFAEFFTGVLYGMSTSQQKSDVFVARPYIKVDGVYYYGECHEASYNDVFNKANA